LGTPNLVGTCTLLPNQGNLSNQTPTPKGGDWPAPALAFDGLPQYVPSSNGTSPAVTSANVLAMM